MRNIGVVIVLACCLSALAGSQAAHARRDHTIPVLHVPATVRGFIGGESHDTYAVSVRDGQRIVVQLDWTREDDNTAQFDVGPSPGFVKRHGTVRGAFSPDGREWNGVGCHARTLHIHVVAHPSAHYVLTIQRDPKPIKDPCGPLHRSSP